MPRSHQTRSQYVLQNDAERSQTVCERDDRCDNCLKSFYELYGRSGRVRTGRTFQNVETAQNPEETTPFRNWTE